MSPSNESPNQGIDPLAPLGQLAHWLTSTTLHVALGALLGLLGARLMRHRHLHWSWAAVALAFVVPVRPLLGGSATVLGLTLFVAAARGRRWHREDLQAGSDLAALAADRWSPLDALRSGAGIAAAAGIGMVGATGPGMDAGTGRTRLVALAGRLFPGSRGYSRWLRDDELIVGEDRSRRPVSMRLGGADGGVHTLVVGATGSGKTVTQTWIATQAIARGMAVVVVDPKDDRWMREQLRHAAAAAGRRFLEWTPEGPLAYNPYARGGDTEIADKILAGERFTEPHYQRQAQRYVGHAVRALRGTGHEVSLAGLVEVLEPARLELLARDLPEGRARAVHAYLDALTPRQRSELTGVRDRLAIMAESDFGVWLDHDASGVESGARDAEFGAQDEESGVRGAESFDLLDAIRARAVVCFSLQADSRPLLSQMLGTAIVLDLQSAVAALQGRPAPCLVVIDEFSAVAAEQVARLFARARSAGLSLILGTQELSDLRLSGREMLLEQVLGNLTSLIAHRQTVPDSAELVARLAGSRGAWRTSLSSDGRSTRTRVREHLIDPDDIKHLAAGQAAVIALTGRRRGAIARMFSPGRPL
jgi:type IV secretory system conjugative DNA transfer VirD4/TraG family protein/helicase HerA-like protein